MTAGRVKRRHGGEPGLDARDGDRADLSVGPPDTGGT